MRSAAAWLGVAGLACGGGGGGLGLPRPAEADLGFRAVVAPFEVVDTAGRVLELAFLGGLNQPRPQLVDLDGDGRLHLLIQEYTGRMLHLRHEGAAADGLPRFGFRDWRFAGLDIGEWSRFADLTGDGRLELFAEWPFSYIRLFRDTGLAGRRAYTALPDSLRDTDGRAIFSDRQNIPQIVDLNCNGRPDLLIGRITGHILHYEVVDPRAAPPVFRLMTDAWQGLEIITGQGSMHGANTMALADFDGDGDLDLFWGDFFEAGLLLFENIGTCAAPLLRQQPIRFPAHQPLVTSGYNAPTFGDLTGDGRPDLVVGVLGGAYDPIRTTIANLHYLERSAGGAYTHRTSQLLPMLDVGSESIPALVDLDGDGDLDLLVANKIEPFARHTSRIYWYENVGTPRAPAFRMRGPLDLEGQYHFAPTFGDLDGDGRLDMLVGSFGPRIAWYKLETTAPEPRFRLVDSAVVTITRGSNTVPALADLDGDGLPDLVVGRASGYLSLFRNVGTRSAPRFELVSDEWQELRPGRRSAPAFVDVDGNGLPDLLLGTDDSGLQLYRNTGTRREPRFQRDPSFAPYVPPLSAPAVGDLDGDGRFEIVVGNAGGGLLYLTRSAMTPPGIGFTEPVSLLDGASGMSVTVAEFLSRAGAADFVLLGELHDNAVHHRVRGELIARLASRSPAVVFEQFAASSGPIPFPPAGAAEEAWLDAHGFDRTAWQWPLHRPVVEAAARHGRALWGSGVSREALRSVVQGGLSGAPEELRGVVEQAPLDDAGRAAMDDVLVAGHCGRLPETMIPGMRAAQEIRDAAMTRALLAAGADGPAWLVAGNGHVRADIAVPRLLRHLAPGRRVLVVGLMEWKADGAPPDEAERRRYDLVIVTPRAQRGDPCAAFRP